jgi:hypothetical protein
MSMTQEAPAAVTARTDTPLTLRDVIRTWWPLAASWLLMGLELPLVSAAIARLPEARVSLAVLGGVVFPLALLIESPVIMLLSASTAFARDRENLRFLNRVMLTLGGGFTALHMLVAFTPLYDLVAAGILGLPPEVREPGRLGLRLMSPWTLAIAFRRTQQGVLIRHGNSRAVGLGTVARLVALLLVLGAGLAIGTVRGSIVGPLALATSVTAEALSAGLLVRPVLRSLPARVPGPPLTRAGFARFYLPLALTPLLAFLTLPIASGAMSRMPLALGSLAASPAVNGLVMTFRSVGFAFNEVVVALLDRPGAAAALRTFARRLALVTSGLLIAVAATPLGALWFSGLSALPKDLVPLAATALLLLVPMPALSVLQSWFQGTLVHAHRTRAVTEAMGALLLVIALVLAAGIAWQGAPGLEVASAAITLGYVTLVAWLGVRARPLLQRKSPGP